MHNQLIETPTDDQMNRVNQWVVSPRTIKNHTFDYSTIHPIQLYDLKPQLEWTVHIVVDYIDLNWVDTRLLCVEIGGELFGPEDMAIQRILIVDKTRIQKWVEVRVQWETPESHPFKVREGRMDLEVQGFYIGGLSIGTHYFREHQLICVTTLVGKGRSEAEE